MSAPPLKTGRMAGWKAVLGLTLSFVLVGICVWFVLKDANTLSRLANTNPLGIGIASLCMIAFLWSNGLVLNEMLRAWNVSLKPLTSFSLSVVTNAGNTFLPLSAGMGLRALYLRKTLGVPLPAFLGALAGIYIVNFLVVFATGFVMLALLRANGSALSHWLLVAFGIATSGLAFVAFAPLVAPRFANKGLKRLSVLMPGSVAKRFFNIFTSWQALLADKRAVGTIALYSILNVALSSGLLWGSFSALGESLSMESALFLSVMNSLAIFLKITPGNLGVNEVLLLAAGSTLSLDPGLVALAAGISRAVQYGTMLFLLPFGLVFLFGAGWKASLAEASHSMRKNAFATNTGESDMTPSLGSPPSESHRKALHGKEYAEAFEAKQDPQRIGRILERLSIPEGGQILDVGCGNALALEWLETLTPNRIGGYTGVDFSEELLAFALARQKALGAQHARFFQGSLKELLSKFGASWVDLAFAFDVSEHVADDEWLEACRDVRKALKPGGAFVLHTPNAGFFLEQMKARNFIVRQFPEHIAVRDAKQNLALLKEAGFSQVTIQILPHYNVLRYVHPLTKLPGLGRLFEARLLLTATA